jgi:O-antigen biosynthesis protein
MVPDLLDCSDLNITATRNDRWGVGEFRITAPLTILQRHGAKVYFVDTQPTHGKIRYFQPEMFENATHIILQRFNDPGIWEIFEATGQMQYNPVCLELRDRWKSGDLKIIYECDDDLLRVDPQNPAAHRKGLPRAGTFTPEVCRKIESIVRRCDALFVSTPDLGARWAHLNSRVFVLPNSIDFSMRPWHIPMKRVERLRDKIVIGWAGGLHHIGDEAPLVGVMREITDRYPHVMVALFSNPITSAHFARAWDMRPDRCVLLDVVDFQRYPIVLSQFDIGLAPLMTTEFNRCKSYLRLIEYGARGIPYVAQRISPYAQFHHETAGIGGYLASGSAEWRNALIRLIEDEEDRKRKGEAIMGVVKDSYAVETTAFKWAAALRAVRNSQGVSTWSERSRPGRNDPCPCGSGQKYKRCHSPAFG